MSAIQQLLQRWGFVKLSQYGLTLTPEGRVASSRPEVLRDAEGSRIVGWRDEDLALTELQPWEPARPAKRASAPERPVEPAAVAPAAVAPIVQAPVQVAPPLRPAASMPAVQPQDEPSRPAYRQVISEASILAQVVEDPSEAVMAEPVAGEPVVEEDDWEWTIALARARAEESVVSPPRTREVVAATPAAMPQSAPVTAKPAKPAPAVAKSATTKSAPAPVAAKPVARPVAKSATRTSPMDALPTMERTRPIAVVASRDPASSGEWPETEATAATIDYGDDFQPATQTKLLYAAPPARTSKPTPAPPVPSRAAQPNTVIPVPALPTVQTAPGRMEPVVRAVSHTPSQANRLAKGTGEVVQRTPSTTAMSEDTLPSLIIGDRTTPGMQLPMAARAVQLPSVKRRMQQR